MFAAFIETVPDAIIAIDSESRVRFVNTAAQELFGWARAELVGRTLERLLPDEVRAPHRAHVASFFARPGRREMGARLQLEAVRKDGSRFSVEVALSPVTVDGERLAVAAVRDVTAQRRLEREARVNEARIHTLMELASVGTWELDLAADRRSYSPEVLKMLGIDRAHASSFEFYRVVHPDDAPAVRAATERAVRERSSYHLALRVRHASGEWRWFETRAFVECDPAGLPLRIRGLVMDITEQRLAREQLAVNDRLRSMGMLAAGVAHEINNPLAALLANLELLRETLTAQGAGRPVETELADAAEAARRIHEIVADMRLFSRTGSDAAGPVDVHAVLETALRLARHETRQRATVVTLWSAVPPVLGSESRLVQVFLNLLVNAAQSIPEEGHPDDYRITVATSADEQGRVRVAVRDTGAGMPPDVVARLFTPFFTTKPAGVGTGLGLAICQRIVTGFGGEIEVSSTPGQGTEFRVLLPAAKRLPRAAEGGRARLLVVEDDRELLASLERSLRGTYEVEVAPGGAEALERVTRGERFDVIVCDLMMPGMSGMELFEAIARLSPGQAERMVFVTGAASSPQCSEFLGTLGSRWLDKPFGPDEVRELVERRLRR